MKGDRKEGCWCGDQRWQWQQSERAVSAGNRFRKAEAAVASLPSLSVCLWLPFVALIGVRRCNIGTSAVILSLPFPFLSYCTSLFLCVWNCVCVPTGCVLATATPYSHLCFPPPPPPPPLPLFLYPFVLSSFLSFFIHSLRSLILIIVSFPRFLVCCIHFVLLILRRRRKRRYRSLQYLFYYLCLSREQFFRIDRPTK